MRRICGNCKETKEDAEFSGAVSSEDAKYCQPCRMEIAKVATMQDQRQRRRSAKLVEDRKMKEVITREGIRTKAWMDESVSMLRANRDSVMW